MSLRAMCSRFKKNRVPFLTESGRVGKKGTPMRIWLPQIIGTLQAAIGATLSGDADVIQNELDRVVRALPPAKTPEEKVALRSCCSTSRGAAADRLMRRCTMGRSAHARSAARR